jgi:glutaredoxin
MKKEYVIYGAKGCNYCDQAKRLLDYKEFPYNYMDAPSSVYFQETFVAQGITKVPQIFVIESDGERHIGGFEELMKEVM